MYKEYKTDENDAKVLSGVIGDGDDAEDGLVAGGGGGGEGLEAPMLDENWAMEDANSNSHGKRAILNNNDYANV